MAIVEPPKNLHSNVPRCFAWSVVTENAPRTPNFPQLRDATLKVAPTSGSVTKYLILTAVLLGSVGYRMQCRQPGLAVWHVWLGTNSSRTFGTVLLGAAKFAQAPRLKRHCMACHPSQHWSKP
jgi:hypothetical protein